MKNPLIQFGIVLALLVAATAGYMVWFLGVEAASSEAASLSMQIAEQSQNSTREAAATRALASLSQEKGDIQDKFVGTEDVVPFLESLQTKGSSLGTSVGVGSVSAVQSPRPHLELTISVKGSFNNVMRTVGAIEYLPYDIQVTNLTLSKDGSGTASSTSWAANATLSVGTKTGSAHSVSVPQNVATTTSVVATTSSATTTP